MEPAYNPPLDPFLEVIYKDDHLLALNKQSGLLSVPGRLAEKKDSIQSRAQSLHPAALTVHRLDMETSGVILMALSQDVHRALSRMFQDRKTDKTYLARVGGLLAEDQGSVDLPLRCDWPKRPRQMVDHELGKAALTHWRVIERRRGETLVKLTPVTGRSHQLRVHMLSLGHPILGDSLYACDELHAAAPHLQLHASTLGLVHPVTGEDLLLKAPCPFE